MRVAPKGVILWPTSAVLGAMKVWSVSINDIEMEGMVLDGSQDRFTRSAGEPGCSGEEWGDPLAQKGHHDKGCQERRGSILASLFESDD